MHTETVMVSFDDLDAMGVVHNAKYVTLLGIRSRCGPRRSTPALREACRDLLVPGEADARAAA